MTAHTVTSTTLAVTGMTCGSCRAHVSRALTTVTGVTDVIVDLQSGTATVTSQAPASIEQLLDAVRRAGYGAEVSGESRPAAAGPNTSTHCSR